MQTGALVIETSDAGWFRVWPAENRVDMPIGVGPVAREVRLLTTPMLLLATLHGRTPLHASCVNIDGRAIAISAPGGFGKTTLAAALAGRGHGLLAEDITVIDETGLVYPGPDLLRLRPDVASRVTTDTNLETVHRTEERVMVRTGRAEPDEVPLAAVVFLKVDPSTFSDERTDSQRLADLWQVTFHLPNLTDRARAFDAVARLADTVPVYDLGRPLTWDSIAWTMDTIEDLAR